MPARFNVACALPGVTPPPDTVTQGADEVTENDVGGVAVTENVCVMVDGVVPTPYVRLTDGGFTVGILGCRKNASTLIGAFITTVAFGPLDELTVALQ